MAQDYKMKYMELRSRFVSSLDVAFRLGYQKGQQDGQMQQMQQQQAQQMQMQQQMMGQMQQPSALQQDQSSAGLEQSAENFENQAQNLDQNGASEIEQGIQELEELLGKGEIDTKSAQSLLNLLNKSLSKLNNSTSLAKSEDLKRMNEGKEIFKQAAIGHNKNIQSKSEEAHSLQKKIVNDILKKWESEEQEAAGDILNTLKIEGKIR